MLLEAKRLIRSGHDHTKGLGVPSITSCETFEKAEASERATGHHGQVAIEDWNIEGGCYSGAFFQWCLTVSNLRGYFKLATGAADTLYQGLWNEAVALAPPEADAFDAFADSVDILPTTFEWLLRATVIITLVSAFDAYVLEAIDEVQRQPGRTPLVDLESRTQTQWPKLVEAYNQLVTDYGSNFSSDQVVAHVETDRVKEIRSLRHILVHRNGTPSTNEDRAAFADLTDHVGKLRLDDALVIGCFNDLDNIVMAVDPLIWTVARDRQTMPKRYHGRRWEVD